MENTRHVDQDEAEIFIEEVGAHWWTRLLATLFSQNGSATYRVNARISRAGGDRAETIRGATFSAVRSFGKAIPPEEAWAPGMTACVNELEKRLISEGWRPSDHGRAPWARRYTRSSR